MASNGSSSPTLPVFDGENYQLWAVKMKTHLRGLGLWQWVEADKDPTPLGNNPTLNQIRLHEEESTKAPKALSYIFSAVSDVIFTRIMACETPKDAWDKLQEEFMGSSRTRRMQILNLKREFERIRMKESETVKEYADRLMAVVNKIRLLGEELTDSRIVEKVLVSLPERFESKISSLEDSKDLSKISLTELIHAFQAQEQRRLIRQEDDANHKQENQKEEKSVEGAYVARQFRSRREKRQEDKPSRRKFSPCPHCKKDNHPENRCFFRPNVRCRSCQQLGHVEKVCPNNEASQEEQAQTTEEEDDHMFVATCFSAKVRDQTWLIDSGCTNHMTPDLSSFVRLDKASKSRVMIGNGEFLDVKGRGTVAVKTMTGTKYISDVLFVPEISQSLLSVGQMLEKDYALHFKDMTCTIVNPDGREFMSVKMRRKSFPIVWKVDESALMSAKVREKKQVRFQEEVEIIKDLRRSSKDSYSEDHVEDLLKESLNRSRFKKIRDNLGVGSKTSRRRLLGL